MTSLLKRGFFKIGILALIAGLACCQHAAQPSSMTRQAVLVSGAIMRYDYPGQFDRNALKTFESTNKGLIALTEAGFLLRFDAQNFHLLNENTRAEYISMTSDARGRLFAGSVDGWIDQIDPVTLIGVHMSRVPGQPAFLVSAGDDLIAIVEQPVQHPQWPFYATQVVWDVHKQKGYELPFAPTTFYLDRQRRLWIGSDHGEFGGDCHALDLNSGAIHEFKPESESLDGVYGFAEQNDGTMLIYGGMSHMGYMEAKIWKTAGETTLKPVYKTDQQELARLRERWATAPDTIVPRPMLPINQMVPLKVGAFVVFSFDDVFVVDRDFTNWRHMASLKLDYSSGRPDAVGSYPAVNAVRDKGGERFIAATAQNGLIEIKDGKMISHALAGQMESRNLFPARTNPFLGDRFKTPDGRTWDVSFRTLNLLVDGNWQVESDLPDGMGLDVKVVAGKGPWILSDGKALYALKEQAGKAPWIEKIYPKTKDNQPTKYWDAIEAADGVLLLATDQGLFRWKIGEPDFDSSYILVNNPYSFCRDKGGRIWIGGEGLWVYNPLTGGCEGLDVFDGGAGSITSMAASPDGGIMAVTSLHTLLKADIDEPAAKKQ